jgi:hypothetical protein
MSVPSFCSLCVFESQLCAADFHDMEETHALGQAMIFNVLMQLVDCGASVVCVFRAKGPHHGVYGLTFVAINSQKLVSFKQPFRSFKNLVMKSCVQSVCAKRQWGRSIPMQPTYILLVLAGAVTVVCISKASPDGVLHQCLLHCMLKASDPAACCAKQRSHSLVNASYKTYTVALHPLPSRVHAFGPTAANVVKHMLSVLFKSVHAQALVQQVCETLCQMSTARAWRRVMVDQGCVILLWRVLQLHQSSKPIMTLACTLMWRLAAESCITHVIPVPARCIVQLLLHLLNRFMGVKDVLFPVCGILCNLMACCKCHSTFTVQAGVTFVLDALRVHASSASMSVVLCGLLSNVAANAGARTKFWQLGGGRLLINVICYHVQRPQVAVLACETLNLFCSGKNFGKHLCNHTVAALQSAAQHAGCRDVGVSIEHLVSVLRIRQSVACLRC